jgi:hypothetical protein
MVHESVPGRIVGPISLRGTLSERVGRPIGATRVLPVLMRSGFRAEGEGSG